MKNYFHYFLNTAIDEILLFLGYLEKMMYAVSHLIKKYVILITKLVLKKLCNRPVRQKQLIA